MDFELSDDQAALRDAARSLLDDRCPPAAVRAAAGDPARVDRALWAAMGAQGWPGVDASEAEGGLGLGLVETAVLAEEVGRHTAPVPFAGTVLARAALAGAAADVALGDATVGTWRSRLATAEAAGAVAWSRRPDAVTARAGADGWTLHGRPDPVVYGPAADVVVVFALDPGEPAGPSLYAVAPGDRRPDPVPAMDVTRSLAWLAFDATPAVRLGGPAEADALWDRAATVVSAEMLGAADRVLAMAVAYAGDRVQFGRPIGSFQAVKHRCADMLVDVEGMRSVAYLAAWSVGASTDEASAAASAAKVWCSDASRRVMASALQVHGGIGFTWEHDLHLFLKRAQLDQVSFGDAGVHRRRLAGLLRPRVEAGQPLF